MSDAAPDSAALPGAVTGAPTSDPPAPTPSTVDAAAACHNCGAALHGRYCAACGQEALPLAPTLRHVVGDVAQELSDFDSRIFRSIQKLFLAPGFLTREYLAGRRVRWVSPLRLYLTFSVAYFALVSLTAGAGVTVRVTQNGAPATSSEERAWLQSRGFQSEQEMEQAIGGSLVAWMPRVMFVLVPLFAWLVSVARRRSGYTYPQHVYFALHAHAAWFGARALVPAARLTSVPSLEDVAGLLTGVYVPIYVVLALRAVYGLTTRRALRDTLLILTIYGIIVVAVTVALMLPFVLWGR